MDHSDSPTNPPRKDALQNTLLLNSELILHDCDKRMLIILTFSYYFQFLEMVCMIDMIYTCPVIHDKFKMSTIFGMIFLDVILVSLFIL